MTTPATAAELSALVEEATRKSGLVWVDGQALWHIWHDGAMYVVGGPGEQPLPDLVDGGTARVCVRSKDKGGRLVSWPARVRLLAPDGEEWGVAVGELKGKRLNTVDPAGIADRWARECRVFRLAPEGGPQEYPGAMGEGSGAAAPVPTPATTRRAIPAGLPRLLTRRT